MFAKAQGLDFRKLKITDVEGKVLARSPVIGAEMIILGGNEELES